MAEREQAVRGRQEVHGEGRSAAAFAAGGRKGLDGGIHVVSGVPVSWPKNLGLRPLIIGPNLATWGRTFFMFFSGAFFGLEKESWKFY